MAKKEMSFEAECYLARLCCISNLQEIKQSLKNHKLHLQKCSDGFDDCYFMGYEDLAQEYLENYSMFKKLITECELNIRDYYKIILAYDSWLKGSDNIFFWLFDRLLGD